MEVAPYGMLLYQLRDKQALVIPDSGAAKLEKTPANPPFTPLNTFDATGTLDKDGTVNVHLVYTLRSDDALVVRLVLRQVPPGQWDQFVQAFSQRLGFGGTTSHVEASRPDATEAPLTLTYDYERKKFGDWDNYKILPLFPLLSFTTVDEADPPRQPIELGPPHVEKATTVLTLPQGWAAQLPEPIHQKSAFATFDQSYRLDRRTLTVERKVEILQPKVPVSDWKSYKKFLDATVTDGERYIQLTSTGEPGGEKGPPVAAGGDDRAANLVKAAFNAVGRDDLDSAEQELDLAKGLNPKQQQLWSTYGFLASQRRQWEKAIEAYDKELALYPNTSWVYAGKADAQRSLGHREDAKDTLRNWLKTSPGDVLPAEVLSNFLLQDGEAVEAVAVLKTAVDKNPDNKVLRVRFGRAQLKAGQTQEGTATLVALLKESTDPVTLNDGAFELADAGAELDLAEKASHQAIDLLTAKTKDWTLEQVGPVQKATTTLLVATWDTLGWALFREDQIDKLGEAESYVRAAWLNRPNAEVGLHLGKIQEKRGDRQAALKTYELAQQSLPHNPPGSSQPASPSPFAKELQQRLDALKQSGVRLPSSEPTPELLKLRTLPAGKAEGLNGVAGYDLLLSATGVVDARPPADAATYFKGGELKVQKIAFPGWVPAGSTARIFRQGALNCRLGECHLILYPQ